MTAGRADGARPAPPLPNVGRPAANALALAGYTRLDQVREVPEADLLGLHGVGPKAIRIIREALREHGWTFGPPIA